MQAQHEADLLLDDANSRRKDSLCKRTNIVRSYTMLLQTLENTCFLSASDMRYISSRSKDVLLAKLVDKALRTT